MVDPSGRIHRETAQKSKESRNQNSQEHVKSHLLSPPRQGRNSKDLRNLNNTHSDSITTTNVHQPPESRPLSPRVPWEHFLVPERTATDLASTPWPSSNSLAGEGVHPESNAQTEPPDPHGSTLSAPGSRGRQSQDIWTSLDPHCPMEVSYKPHSRFPISRSHVLKRNR